MLLNFTLYPVAPLTPDQLNLTEVVWLVALTEDGALGAVVTVMVGV